MTLSVSVRMFEFMRTFITVLITVSAISLAQSQNYPWAKTKEGCKIQNPYGGEEAGMSWSGDCVDGIAEGNGIVKWQRDGVPYTYSGSLKNGLFDGEGAFSFNQSTRAGIFKLGSFLEGRVIYFEGGDTTQVHEGVFNNYVLQKGSRYFYDKGKVYAIESFDSEMKGPLTGECTRLYFYESGDTSKYETGIFKDGKLTSGTHLKFDGKVWTLREGKFTDDNLVGPGTSTVYAHGKILRKYEGVFPEASAKGPGTLTLGFNRFEGNFNKGSISGKAKVYYKDNLVYEGEILNMAYHGMGHRWYLKGRQHIGSWKNGAMNGFGLSLWPDGSYYIGEFADGLFEGNGIFYTSNQTSAGKWESGENTSPSSTAKVKERLKKAYWEDYNKFNKLIDVH